MVPVAPWVSQRLYTLGATTAPTVTCADFTADRRAMVLRRWRDDTRWAAFEAALHQDTVRVYALQTPRVQVESTSASADATVPARGLCQGGHRQDDRPDLPQGKGMPAVLAPLGMPWATAVGAGERAADPL
jgi:transposase